jgi:hypothetical protein
MARGSEKGREREEKGERQEKEREERGKGRTPYPRISK